MNPAWARLGRRWWAGYAVALVSVSVATLLKLQFHWIGRDLPVATYLAAIMVSAWFGGTGAGLAATALATVGGAFFFAEPYDSLAVATTQDAAAIAVGSIEGTFVSLVIGALRRARIDAERRAAELARTNAELEREIEARGRAEGALRSMTAQLVHAQRMESVGRMAGGVAHDFNNMLTIVLSYTDVLLRRLGREDRSREDIEQMRAAGQRAADLAGQLLSFSRREASRVEPIDLGDLVSRIEPMVRRLVGSHVALTLRVRADLWTIDADAGQVEQVVMNLAANARDAMPNGGELAITTENVEIDADEGARLGTPAGPHVLLRVRDTGTGMDEATAAKALEPFFTTKERGKGTGLGLAVVTSVLEQSRGVLHFESTSGKGTEARVHWPRSVPPPSSP